MFPFITTMKNSISVVGGKSISNKMSNKYEQFSKVQETRQKIKQHRKIVKSEIPIEKWKGECLRKKKLKRKWANEVIRNAKATGTTLYRYICSHCGFYHVTKNEKHGNNSDRI